MHPLQTLEPFITLGFWIAATSFGLKNEFILPRLDFIFFFPGVRRWL
jgi:hypothetical protein